MITNVKIIKLLQKREKSTDKGQQQTNSVKIVITVSNEKKTIKYFQT